MKWQSYTITSDPLTVIIVAIVISIVVVTIIAVVLSFFIHISVAATILLALSFLTFALGFSVIVITFYAPCTVFRYPGAWGIADRPVPSSKIDEVFSFSFTLTLAVRSFSIAITWRVIFVAIAITWGVTITTDRFAFALALAFI